MPRFIYIGNILNLHMQDHTPQEIPKNPLNILEPSQSGCISLKDFPAYYTAVELQQSQWNIHSSQLQQRRAYLEECVWQQYSLITVVEPKIKRVFLMIW